MTTDMYKKLMAGLLCYIAMLSIGGVYWCVMPEKTFDEALTWALASAVSVLLAKVLLDDTPRPKP